MENRNGTNGAAQPEGLVAEARNPPEAQNETSSPSEVGPSAAKENSSDHEEADKRRTVSTNVRDSDYPKRVPIRNSRIPPRIR